MYRELDKDLVIENQKREIDSLKKELESLKDLKGFPKHEKLEIISLQAREETDTQSPPILVGVKSITNANNTFVIAATEEQVRKLNLYPKRRIDLILVPHKEQ